MTWLASASFTSSVNQTLSGSIRNLSLNVKNGQFRPVEKTSPKEPDIRS